MSARPVSTQHASTKANRSTRSRRAPVAASSMSGRRAISAGSTNARASTQTCPQRSCRSRCTKTASATLRYLSSATLIATKSTRTSRTIRRQPTPLPLLSLSALPTIGGRSTQPFHRCRFCARSSTMSSGFAQPRPSLPSPKTWPQISVNSQLPCAMHAMNRMRSPTS